MIILGIDPGLQRTGFGVIDLTDKNSYQAPQYIASGTIITTSKQSLATRIATIFSGVGEIITTYQVACMAIEQVFVNSNPHSSLLLGQARAVAICAGVANKLPVFEYSALQVKKSVVGYGHAEKSQVAYMVQKHLNLNKAPRADAADALAIALTHSYRS